MNKEILKLAIPNILANLSVPLVSTVDLGLMGHLNDESYLLAIGFGVMIFNFVYWAFGFLRMGVTGMTAQEVGKKDIDESFRVLFRGLFIAFSGAIVLISFHPYILKLALSIIDSSSTVNNEITTYFNIRIYAAPATIGLYAFIGWFLGKQNAVLPMVITILVNATNAVLSFILVNKYHLDTKGVAMGTVFSQYFGFLVAFILFFINYRKDLTKQAFNYLFKKGPIVNFLKVNGNIFIRTMCLILVLSLFKVFSGDEGLIIGAANMVLLEFIGIASYGIDGFAFAAESIVGKYYGANDKIALNKSIKYAFVWGFGIASIYSLAFWLFGNNIIALLTSQTEVQLAAHDYLIWLIAYPIIGTAAFIYDGIFIGITAGKAMRNTMLAATAIYLPAYYLLQPLFENHGLWLAFLLFIAMRGFAQKLVARKLINL